jgi:hypothetical protein
MGYPFGESIFTASNNPNINGMRSNPKPREIKTRFIYEAFHLLPQHGNFRQSRSNNQPSDSASVKVGITSGRFPKPNQRRIESTRMMTAATIMIAVSPVLM